MCEIPESLTFASISSKHSPNSSFPTLTHGRITGFPCKWGKTRFEIIVASRVLLMYFLKQTDFAATGELRQYYILNSNYQAGHYNKGADDH